MKESTCTVPDCAKASKNYFKFCPSHQYRNWRYGSPHGSAYTPLEDRFWSNVRKGDGCWEWTAGLSGNGYATISVDGKPVGTHRLSYEWAHGEIPDGMFVDHACRNRACVNPEHLRLVTHKQNCENLGVQKNNTSGARGVHFDRRKGKWAARVKHNYRLHHGGFFDTVAEADVAVRALRRKLFTHSIDD